MARIAPGSAPFQVRLDGGTLTNYGPGDVVYGDDQNVTVDNFEGTITVGQSLSYPSSMWVLAPSAVAEVAVSNAFVAQRADSPFDARHATGRYYYPIGLFTGASALVVNQLIALPIAISGPQVFDRICVNIGVAGTAGSVVRLGLYMDDGTGSPSGLILDAGAAATASTGAKELPINQTLDTGWVWIAGAAQVAAPSVTRTQGFFPPFGQFASTVTNSALASAYVHNGTVSGALPNVFAPTSTNVGFAMSLRAA